MGRASTRTLGYLAERIVSLGLAAAVGVIVARHLGPQGLGTLTFGMAVFALLAPLTTLGMPSVLVREFSTRPDWRSVMESALAPQLPVAILAAVGGFLVVAAWGGFEREVVLLALALTPMALGGLSASVRAYFEAMGRVAVIVVTGLTAASVAAGIRLLSVATDGPLWLFGAGTSASVLVVLGGMAIFLPPRGHAAGVRPATPIVERSRLLLTETWPLLVASLAIAVYMQADLVMLGMLTDEAETGVYAAAARLSEVWYFVPTALIAAVHPQLSRLHASGARRLYEATLQRLLTAGTVAAVGSAAVVVAAAPTLIDVLYGAEFERSAAVLRLHILTAPFVFLGVIAGPWFIDRGLTRFVMHRAIAGAGLNIVLNLVLIPRHGPFGAAVATMVSYAISSVLLNSFGPARPLFRLQLRSLRLSWPRVDQDLSVDPPRAS